MAENALVSDADQIDDLVKSIGGGSEESQGDDGVETEEHGTLEVVGLAVLDGVGDDENGNRKSDSLN